MMGGQFGRPMNDPLYHRDLDYMMFTKALVAAGYRPYSVAWKSGSVDEVWMKPGQGAGLEGEGAVVLPVVMENGMLINETPIILVDPFDGGYITEYGRVIGFQPGITKAA